MKCNPNQKTTAAINDTVLLSLLSQQSQHHLLSFENQNKEYSKSTEILFNLINAFDV